jgi:hypothetical protein
VPLCSSATTFPKTLMHFQNREREANHDPLWIIRGIFLVYFCHGSGSGGLWYKAVRRSEARERKRCSLRHVCQQQHCNQHLLVVVDGEQQQCCQKSSSVRTQASAVLSPQPLLSLLYFKTPWRPATRTRRFTVLQHGISRSSVPPAMAVPRYRHTQAGLRGSYRRRTL